MADGHVIIDIKADDSDIKKKLKAIKSEAADTADSVDDLGDSSSNAASGMKDLGDNAGKTSKAFSTADVAIGSFVGSALSNLASKVVETVGNIAALADETREYREDIAKLDAAFTTAGHSTETANEAYSSFYKILGESDRSVEAVNHLAELTKNEKEVAQWGTIAAGVTAKFGDSLPIEGLTEAANETAKVGKVTGPLADALNWAGISEDEFNKKLTACNTEQERASLITSTLNTEYAAAAEEYNKLTANTQAARDATNNMEQAQAALGAAIEPVTIAWTNMKANALQWFIDTGLPALQTGWQWIKDNLPAIAVIVGGLTAALLAYGGAQTLLNAVQKIGTAVQTALNAAMNANPIGVIILGITALVAGFMLLWNNCEGFRNFWIGLWENIKAVLSPFIEWLKQAFSEAWAKIQEVWNTVQPYFMQIWEKIKEVFAVVKEVLGEFFGKAWEAIKTTWDFVFPYFKMIWENIKVVFSVVKTYLGGMFNAAWVSIKAVWDNVTGYFNAVWETIKGIFAVVKAVLSGNWSEAWEAIKGIVNTWKQYFLSVWENIKGVFSAVESWFGNTFKAAWDGIKAIWGNVKQFFSDTWTKIKEAFNISDMFSIGSDLLKGLWNGIGDKVEWLKGKVKGVVDKIKSWFTGKDGFDEHSPSKWAYGVAEYVNEGSGIGFEKTAHIPIDAAKKVTERIKAVVSSENARMAQGAGVSDTGFSEVAQAVGMQTAGINSLASEYRKGTNSQTTIPLILNGRELGRAIVDVLQAETTRTGITLA